MWSRIKNFFNAAVRKFRKLLKNIFVGAVEVGVAQIQDIATQVVKELVSSNMNNDEKRAAAFSRIRDIAKLKGVEVKDNWVNLAISLGVQALKASYKHNG